MQDLQEILCRSLTYFHQRQYAEAEELLERGLAEYADSSSLWQLLGLVQNQSGAWQKALVSLERASYISPLQPTANYTLAMCYLWSGRKELAVLLLRKLATAKNTPATLLPLVASTLGSMQEFVLALAACRNILRQDNHRHDAHFGVGFYLCRIGPTRCRSVDAFRRAHELAPQVGLYRIALAGLLKEAGEFEEAYDLLRGVAVEEMRCPAAVSRLWQMLESLGDHSASGRCRRRMDELEQNQTPTEDDA